MGGANETTVAASPTVTGKGANLGDIRIHESQGEVHFHSDSSKLKVAVPVAVWYKAWTELVNKGGEFCYVDTQRKTSLLVAVEITTDGSTGKSTIDAEVQVGEITVGDTFKALASFTTGKK